MTTERNRRQRQVAGIGGSGIEEGSESWILAEEVGRGLAEAGVTVVCGGGGGVMEAASRAAAEAGGEEAVQKSLAMISDERREPSRRR
jgi:predicted Rossmann-fold nucleotide-binding protein